jgi:uncharacterized membrane protein YphA (DoxX/SURF4 family)
VVLPDHYRGKISIPESNVGQGRAMRIDPTTDIWKFLTEPHWTTPVFWLLFIASLVIAFRAFIKLPEQHSVQITVQWIVRLIVGCMWWQQSLWKLPPNFDGLRYWTEQMVEHAAYPVHGQLVKNIVLANFVPFAYAVYFIEVAVAVSLMLGLFVRAGSIVGGLLILNLYFGLYRSPAEWPWTYLFLILLMVLFAVGRYGRSLGADALIIARRDPPKGLLARLMIFT